MRWEICWGILEIICKGKKMINIDIGDKGENFDMTERVRLDMRLESDGGSGGFEIGIRVRLNEESQGLGDEGLENIRKECDNIIQKTVKFSQAMNYTAKYIFQHIRIEVNLKKDDDGVNWLEVLMIPLDSEEVQRCIRIVQDLSGGSEVDDFLTLDLQFQNLHLLQQKASGLADFDGNIKLQCKFNQGAKNDIAKKLKGCLAGIKDNEDLMLVYGLLMMKKFDLTIGSRLGEAMKSIGAISGVNIFQIFGAGMGQIELPEITTIKKFTEISKLYLDFSVKVFMKISSLTCNLDIDGVGSTLLNNLIVS